MIRYNDDEILNGLVKRDSKIIQFIYDTDFEKVSRMINANSGNDDDAEDVFQESLIIIFKRLRENPDFRLSSSFSTYIYSVNRLLWLKKLRNRRKTDIDTLDREMEEYLEFEEPPPVQDKDLQYAIFQKNLKYIPEDCQKILTLTASAVPAKEIADRLGYKSDSYVRKRRHFCKEYLINQIKKDQDYRDMIE